MRYLVFAAFFLLTIPLKAQTDWVKTIEGNKVSMSLAPGFPKARSGFALYYSTVGPIDEPYLVYVPKSYDPSKSSSLVVFLHGAILARESFQHTDPAIAEEPIFSAGDPYNAIILFPFARADLKWSGSSPVYENIISMIEHTEGLYNIDKSKVYIGGISMGGMATFWFIDHHPELFAGFYAFSAMPVLTEEKISFSNLAKKPLYSMNAKDDPGFSYSEVHGIYEQHKSEAKEWHFESVETGGHRFIYTPKGRHYVTDLLGKLTSDKK